MDVEMHICKLERLRGLDVMNIRSLLDTDCIETMTKYLNRDSVAALATSTRSSLTDRFTPGRLSCHPGDASVASTASKRCRTWREEVGS
jgi:hypothetical protein